ncbi:aminopeptidase P family protein [Peptoniphilus sp. AGMB00490]|uniref:Aminopeptidase P family protein n=1 Tax=Peptoniphilus faecalis TaxID=2731255 RepID=A0A848RBF3_9FIRM|nr:aminopeptidase P family protein [Peptoniphilus faecalis]NMW84160.1 aminopeptidase P family protein [Peptoniphilus faecalis]
MILNEIRNIMKEKNIDFYIIPTKDPHGSEYLPDYYKEREFVTGFTGSQGTAVITGDEAYLWTDGRYFIQAAKEIKDFGFELQKEGQVGVLNYTDWISENIKEGMTLGLNAEYFSHKNFFSLSEKLKYKNVKIIDIDLISDLWKYRYPLPKDDAFLLDVKYAGKTSDEKISKIRKILENKKVDMTIVSSLVDIAWTLNIRGMDIKDTPVLISFMIIENDKVILFADREKTKSIEKEISDVVELRDYSEFYDYIKSYKDKKIYLDPNSINEKIYKGICEKNEIIFGNNISENLKAIKNEIEIENLEDTYVRDGVALFKYIYWLKKNAKNKIGEYEAGVMLDNLRAEDPLYISNSFETISAYGANAAMMHYHATRDKESIIEPKGFYLVDSGGQYYSGTTDITRTIAMGELTDEEVRDYTLTLKSHINLMDAVFLKGTYDLALDGIARYALWQERLDYKCGTGHGIGFVLSVHEGPHRISPRDPAVRMKENMIVSNEPGVYKENKYGIRIENIMRVVFDCKTEDSIFNKFKTISFCPFELKAIDANLLTDRQLEVLNSYHREVFTKLSPFFEGEILDYLRESTKEVIR